MAHSSYIQIYRQKPIPEVEAVQLQIDNFEEVVQWITKHYTDPTYISLRIDRVRGRMILNTPGNARTNLELSNYILRYPETNTFRVLSFPDFRRIYEIKPEPEEA